MGHTTNDLRIEDLIRKTRGRGSRPNYTKEEAVLLHRHMWNWIADESEKTRRHIWKDEYIKEFDLKSSRLSLNNNCWACLYTDSHCEVCPIDWDNEQEHAPCCYRETPYSMINKTLPIEQYVMLARQIANLPAKE